MYKIIKLKNNIPVVMYKMQYSLSVSIGYFIKAGTVNEDSYNSGISHFIEHMLFKGTANKSAMDIASTIDHLGGDINAYTSKECTGIYAKVLPKDITTPIDIISDMIMNSLFDEADIDKEKSVIKEEIKSYDDTPEEINYDLLSEIVYKGTYLTHPILGTLESVDAITREEIINYIKTFYTNENIAIAVAGDFDEDLVIDKLNETIGNYNNNTNKKISAQSFIENQSGYHYRSKDFEQTHIDLSFWGPDSNSELYYAAHIFNNILAGTMSSRLFQKIREEKGLVYTIYSQINSYEMAGNMTIGYSLGDDQLEHATEVVIDELLKIKNNGITIEEFDNSRKHLIGNVALNTETSDAYMSMMAKELLFNRPVKHIDEIIEEIQNTTYEDILKVIELFFNQKKAISSVGKIEKKDIMKLYNLMINKLEG